MIETDAELQGAITAVRAAARLCERVRRQRAPEAMIKGDRSPVTIADYGAQAVACRLIADAFPDDPIVGEEGSAALRGPGSAATIAALTAQVAVALDSERARSVEPTDVLEWIDLGGGQPAARFWTLDPIDGTRGFIRGDHYAVALALIVDGEVRVAALACPALDAASLGPASPPALGASQASPRAGVSTDAVGDVTGDAIGDIATGWRRGGLGPGPGTTPGSASDAGALVVATRAGGAWAAPLNGPAAADGWRRLEVCDMRSATCRRFVESVESRHADHTLQRTVARSAGIDAPPLRMDSQAKYAAIAGGLAALYLRLPRPGIDGYREKIWDHAAGALIVEEAGGRVTDMQGRPLDFGRARLAPGGGVVASNGTIHRTVIDAIRG